MPKSNLTKLRLIYENIIETSINEEEFSKGHLIKKFNIDSLIALQIIVEIEKSFHCIIEDDEIAIKIVDSPSFFLDFNAK